MKEAKKEIKRRAFDELTGGLEILPAQLSDDAGVVGAASLVFHALGGEKL